MTIAESCDIEYILLKCIYNWKACGLTRHFGDHHTGWPLPTSRWPWWTAWWGSTARRGWRELKTSGWSTWEPFLLGLTAGMRFWATREEIMGALNPLDEDQVWGCFFQELCPVWCKIYFILVLNMLFPVSVIFSLCPHDSDEALIAKC